MCYYLFFNNFIGMKFIMKKLTLLSMMFVLAACASNANHSARVDVAKSDGSRQCEGAGVSPETMQRELQHIKVYAVRKDHLRGVMFPAVCGGGTGSVNVYTISASDVEIAKQRGFHVFRTEEF